MASSRPVQLRGCEMRVAAGDGVVVRAEDWVLVAAEAKGSPAVDRLLTVLAAAAGEDPFRRLAAELVRESSVPWPAFGLAVDTGDAVVVLLRGDVGLEITTADGASELLSGRRSRMWLDRVIDEPFVSLAIGVGRPGRADAGAPLGRGAVPGGGVAIFPGPAEAAEGETSIDVPHVLVQGVNCVRGHFNPPQVAYCRLCGTSMAHKTLRVVTGPRPPLGVVVLEDGQVVKVDRDLVLGRAPGTHPEVAAGHAQPVTIDDARARVSRCHAALVLDGWTVAVVDLGSSNGTSVILPGQPEPTSLTSNVRAPVVAGTTILLGDYAVRFDSSFG